MSKNNVHPDHYKTAGRDRQDDAAAARQARAMAKTSSRERPNRMGKGRYFERPAPADGAVSNRREEGAQPSPAARRASSKASATGSQKESSAPRTQRKPTASSTRTTARSAKKNAAAATRRPTKKR